MADVYSAAFFDNQRGGSANSAAILLPLLVDIFEPQSLLDVGCGMGTWLKTAGELGLVDYVGVDGLWASPVLTIAPDRFRARDLATPFDLGRRFDLAISMEVAEHIVPASAETFISNIVRHADAVVFSAAAPYQGGVHHVNEQWPPYWTTLFAHHDYRCFDFLRWRIWNDRRIAAWYRQNLLIFANRNNPELIRRLETHASEPMAAGTAVIHPEMWSSMMNSKSLRLQRAVSPVLRSLRALLPKVKRSAGPQPTGKF